MATNFPSALDTYVTKVDNVDDVVAADVNDLQSAVAALEAKLGINGSAVTSTFDYFLKHASGAYRTHVHDATSDDGAKVSLGNLAEVSLASVQNLQYLRYNATSSKWENVTLSIALDDLSDVLISAPATRDSIYYNGASWVNGNPYAVYAP